MTASHLVTGVAFGVAGWLLIVGLFGVITSRHLIHLVLCLTVVQASTYVLLTGVGYRPHAQAPVFADSPPPKSTPTHTVDPIVQALMLTDVVVEATVAALLLAITVQIKKKTGRVEPDGIGRIKG